MAQVEINKPAPDFMLYDLNGKQIRLADFKDRNNVLLVLNRGLV